MDAPVLITHPPSAVITEHIVEFLLESFIIIPSFILIGELACPLTLTPRVTDSKELKAIDLTHVKDTVSMIKEDASLASTISLLAILVLDDICATNKETLLVVLFQVLPEHGGFDHLGNLWCSQVEFLAGTASQIDERLSHGATIEGLVATMELGIGLLHERYPELVGVCAVTVERSLCLRIIWDAGVDNDILPTAIFEELENCKPVFEAIINDQVLKKLGMSRENQERPKEPAVSKNTLLYITWSSTILNENSLVRSDFMRSFPFYLRKVI